jgi:cysteine-rich repeat protein
VVTTIDKPAPDDGCCPPGANAGSDHDCAALCGNSVVEAGETCDPKDSCPSSATCTSGNACLKPLVSGAAASCTATCTLEPISDCKTGDGCCPAGCSRKDDGDCSPSCGDGLVDPAAGETCEPNSATQPCPSSCDDQQLCTVDAATGSASNCNSACTHTPITAPKRGDGCCPFGANANDDPDCSPSCGNGAIEAGELCDGSCPASASSCNDNQPCTLDSLTGSGCTRQCAHSAISAALPAADGCCPAGANANTDGDCAARCGNTLKEPGEDCDDGNTVSGDGCSASCKFDDNTATKGDERAG